MICDKDCEHCKFDDCINDEFSDADFAEAERVFHAFLQSGLKRKRHRKPLTEEQKQKKAVRRKEYRERNCERIKREKAQWYQDNKASVRAQQMEYRAKHYAEWCERGKELAEWQRQRKINNLELAQLIGRSPRTVENWRRGYGKVPEWLMEKLRDLSYDPREAEQCAST